MTGRIPAPEFGSQTGRNFRSNGIVKRGQWQCGRASPQLIRKLIIDRVDSWIFLFGNNYAAMADAGR